MTRRFIFMKNRHFIMKRGVKIQNSTDKRILTHGISKIHAIAM